MPLSSFLEILLVYLFVHWALIPGWFAFETEFQNNLR